MAKRISDVFSTIVVPWQTDQEEHKAILSCCVWEDFLLRSTALGNPSYSDARLFHAVVPCLMNGYGVQLDIAV